MNYINGYLTETREITGIDSPDVTTFGENIHLNGLQATAYSRIRYTAFYNEDGTSVNNDYGRAARQRNVITKMVGKAKDAGVQNVMKMCDEIFQSEEKIFKTSIPYEDVIKLIPIVLNFSFGETGAFPFTLTTKVFFPITHTSPDSSSIPLSSRSSSPICRSSSNICSSISPVGGYSTGTYSCFLYLLIDRS